MPPYIWWHIHTFIFINVIKYIDSTFFVPVVEEVEENSQGKLLTSRYFFGIAVT